MPPRARLRRLAVVVTLPLLVLSACTDDDPDADPTASSTATASEPTSEPTEPPEPTEPSEPTESPESTEPTEPPTSETEPPEQPTDEPTEEPTPEPTPTPEPEPTDEPTSPPRGPAGALLTGASLPAPGDLQWQSVRTRRGTGPGDVSVCMRPQVDLESIGATRGATATFTAGTVGATHVVAEFADEQSAQNGYEILQAWLGQCADHAGQRGFQEVKAPDAYTALEAGDQAGWALVSYGPVPDDPDAAYIEPQVLVRSGDTLSWVVWEETGQDYNYPAGRTPPERAAPLMADALTRS